MRIGAVFIYGDDWTAGRHQSVPIESRDNKVLQIIFGQDMAAGKRESDVLERFVDDSTYPIGRDAMGFQLPGIPHGLEPLNEIRRSDNVDAETLEELNGTGIDARDIGYRVQWRVLHGDSTRATHNLLKRRVLVSPGYIGSLLAGQDM